jgi:two-component system sensor kinase FixL
VIAAAPANCRSDTLARELRPDAREPDGTLPDTSGEAGLGWLEQVFAPQATGTFHWDVVADQHSWTEEFQALYGLSDGAPAPRPDIWLEAIHPDDRADLTADIARAAEDGEAFERTFRLVSADGSIRWMRAHCRLERDEAGALRRLVIDNADITALKAAEQAIHDCRHPLQQMHAAALVGAYVADLASGQVWLSPSLAQCLAFDRASISVAELRTRFEPQDAETFQAALARAHAGTDAGRVAAEGRIRGFDGAARWLCLCGQTLFRRRCDGKTAPIHQVGAVADITEQRNIEEELAEREAAQRSILDTGPDAIIVIDDRAVIRAFNAVAQRKFGYSAEEAIGRNVSMLMTGEHAGGHNGYVQRYVATGHAAIIGSSREVEARRKDGTVFPAELYIGQTHSGERRSFVGFLRDLSDRHQAEAKLRAAQTDLFHAGRMSAMGEIAAAIAHELNQPLSAATNFLNAARRFLERGDCDEQARQALSSAASEQVRAGQILQRLRRFLTKEDDERRREPLADLLKEAVQLATVAAGSVMPAVNWDLAPDLGDALVDRIQIQQVVVNLVRNAQEATRAQAQDRAPTIWIRALRISPELVQVAIEDNGPGIDPEILARLFDPFASTKGSGMGIGLRICKTIIENHRGRLVGENSPAGGARFVFTLPAA